MTLLLKLILIPIISALIGWITNKIAVWLLFNPKNPTKILFWTFQGVFPKRQSAIASRIGDLVADELLSTESIKGQVFTDENLSGIVNFILNKSEFEIKNSYYANNIFNAGEYLDNHICNNPNITIKKKQFFFCASRASAFF